MLSQDRASLIMEDLTRKHVKRPKLDMMYAYGCLPEDDARAFEDSAFALLMHTRIF